MPFGDVYIEVDVSGLRSFKPERRKNMFSFAATLVALYACSSSLQWTPASAANILAVQTIPGKSHWNVMRSMLRALTDRGHTLTVFTPFVDGDRDGYTEVDVSEKIAPNLGINATFLIENYIPLRKAMPSMINHSRKRCDMIYGHPRMVDILNRAAAWHFDLVVTEPFMSECVAYVANVLGVPMVHVVAFPVVTYSERPLTGHVPNLAAAGHAMSRRGTPKTFAERFGNVALMVYCSALTWYTEWKLRRSNPRPYDAMDLVRPSMIFINSHSITIPARSQTSDFVQIGGIHLTPPEPIPKDILEFIDDAPHGVIFLSFGSMILMSSLPETVQLAFKDALARVPQKVLWKYEEKMKEIPDNVMSRKWFPQRDILLHTNVKLFISHGGISGVYESLDAAVPVLGFPIYHDQHRNIENLVNAGMAIGMDLLSVTEGTLLNAISEIVNNDRYQKNAKIASERFKDRPMSPAESVVYWTEYVLRHKGAPHLKSHALNLTWYQYFLVNVISTFLFIAFVVLFIIYYGLRVIRSHICTFFHSVNTKSK
ncbi:UDP-glucuronosyltransferase 2B15-like isoform X2 [Myzus persicae]|uniref:UDP-glucuronosyltransferase 2B15-like isoform X2 n=1 Tax=Myzus persicae TaxID=13164 RepID=UPI000B932D6D|nr:UDP-glucuronosyltransferase 2B15-like isoform X2 [Myzus persicae]